MRRKRNPLTRSETKDIMREAALHRRIASRLEARKAHSAANYYAGQAEGMRDVADEYREHHKANPRREPAPPVAGAVRIYSRILVIYASKAGMPHECDDECRRANHVYRHDFTTKNSIWGLQNGAILVV